jgi:hypothetical protein
MDLTYNQGDMNESTRLLSLAQMVRRATNMTALAM